jgi:hypothetical protein
MRPVDQMYGLVAGFWVARAVHVAAQLGIADHVAGGPLPVPRLAELTDTHAPTLYRLLRALASVGVFAETDDGTFASTPLADTLRSDRPESLRALVISELGGAHYQAWGDLLHSLRTGETAMDHALGMTVWEYFAKNPEQGQAFNTSMTRLTRTVADAVVAAYDFTPYARIVDVGGGQGEFLRTVLAANPSATGILFDLPSVVESVPADGHHDRITRVGGDFFASVPSGGDLYVLKWVIHDWSDADCARILRNCRVAMPDDATLLVVDTIIPAGNEPSPSKFIDLVMLVANGGRERTEAEFAALFDTAGFSLTQVVPTRSPNSVVVARPAAR